MLREDNLVVGLAMGAVVPVLAYVLLESLQGALFDLGLTAPDGAQIEFRQRTLALLAVCANLGPFFLQSRLRNEKSLRGVVIATAIYAIMWFGVYGPRIFSGA